MMTVSIYNQLQEFSDSLIKKIRSAPQEKTAISTEFWNDCVVESQLFRRAHVSCVDAMDQRGLYMLHCTIFPHLNDPSPIFGLDIICGKTRISGAFHDFSAGGDPHHYMLSWFDNEVETLNWKKERKLPEWAQNIFSPAMVAIGAVSTQDETDQLITVCNRTVDYYLDNVGFSFTEKDYREYQNYYCYYQKQNPHNPRTMQMLGLTEEQANNFIENVMFPEVK